MTRVNIYIYIYYMYIYVHIRECCQAGGCGPGLECKGRLQLYRRRYRRYVIVMQQPATIVRARPPASHRPIQCNVEMTGVGGSYHLDGRPAVPPQQNQTHAVSPACLLPACPGFLYACLPCLPAPAFNMPTCMLACVRTCLLLVPCLPAGWLAGLALRMLPRWIGSSHGGGRPAPAGGEATLRPAQLIPHQRPGSSSSAAQLSP